MLSRFDRLHLGRPPSVSLEVLPSGSRDFQTGDRAYNASIVTALNAGSDFTLSGWIRPSNAGAYPYFFGFDARGAGNPASVFIEQENALNNAIANFRPDSGSDAFVSAALTPLVWENFVVTFDASLRQIELFIGGVSQGTASTTGDFTSSAEYSFGGSTAFGGLSAKALGCNARVYDRILSGAEITNLAGLNLSIMTRSGLIGYWLVDNTAAAFTDQSGNGSDLTNVGAAGNADMPAFFI